MNKACRECGYIGSFDTFILYVDGSLNVNKKVSDYKNYDDFKSMTIDEYKKTSEEF